MSAIVGGPATTAAKPRSIRKVAVIGGGITGAVVATELAKHDIQVVLFDQGRRGPGGRASHRSVDPSTLHVLPDDDRTKIASGEAFEFDHGCQFFRADSTEMKNLVKDWMEHGWVAEWSARWSRIGEGARDFFGLPGNTAQQMQSVYVGIGGMHHVPRQLLASSSPNVVVHRGTRVSQVTPRDDSHWDLWGATGTAAFHGTPEEKAQVTGRLLETADAVVVTDASASQDTWHRASAGLPREFVQGLSFATRPRVPFFSCMVALKQPIRRHLQLDAFVAESPLWCAVCSNSKPGFADNSVECWTLVSTPDFSVKQIQETSMRDRTTGAFRPQENDYLNTVPGPLLLDAFIKAVKPSLPPGVSVDPLYLQAQRWGSGLPAPHETASTVSVDGLDYVDRVDSLVYSQCDTNAKDFIANDEHRLFYAGDFCSNRNPGFEAAALSGRNLAQHIVKQAQSTS